MIRQYIEAIATAAMMAVGFVILAMVLAMLAP